MLRGALHRHQCVCSHSTPPPPREAGSAVIPSFTDGGTEAQGPTQLASGVGTCRLAVWLWSLPWVTTGVSCGLSAGGFAVTPPSRGDLGGALCTKPPLGQHLPAGPRWKPGWKPGAAAAVTQFLSQQRLARVSAGALPQVGAGAQGAS